MIPHPGPPANGAGGPSPSVEALGGVEETPPAIAGGSRPPAQAGGHPPNANALGGLCEVPPRYQGAGSSRASKLRKVAREESGVTGSVIGTSASSEPRPVRSKQPIAYLHESAYYVDPSPSSHCYQRQHQGELCPDSHGCSNSIQNIHTTSREAPGETGMVLVAQRDILTDEVIAVFGDAAILQEQGLTTEFADLINTYNSKHPTRGFQYSIFKNVAGDTHQSVVIPDHDRVLALEVGNISSALRISLQERSYSRTGTAHLANHTCCSRHRNARLEVVSVVEGEDAVLPQALSSLGKGAGPSGRRDGRTRTLAAILRAEKPIAKGATILTCYRNVSTGGTSSQLAKERDTLKKMFSCRCCQCAGPCSVMLPASGPPPGEDGVVPDAKGTPAAAGQAVHNTTPSLALEIKVALQTDGPLPTPVCLKWPPQSRSRKVPRFNPTGPKPTRSSKTRPRLAPETQTIRDMFAKALPREPPVPHPVTGLPDVREAVLRNIGAGELLYTESKYVSQPSVGSSDNLPPIEFCKSDFGYPLLTSSTSRTRPGVERPSGYTSLMESNWVCGETITSTLHIMARAEGWGLQDMPPQPLQTIWIGNSAYWSRNLLMAGSDRPLTDPVYDAGISGSFFGRKPKQIRKASLPVRIALLRRALQVAVAYIPYNIHSNHWVYFRIDLASNTITLHDPLPPNLRDQSSDTKRVLHRLAEWANQFRRIELLTVS